MKDYFDVCRDLKTAIDSIDSATAYIFDIHNKINDMQTRNQRQADFYRFKIVKSIMHLICKGYDEDSAVEEVSAAYSHVLQAKYVTQLWHASRRQRNALNLYARIYAVRLMRDSGMQINTIADIMKLSRNSVTKLLKSDAVLD